MKKTIWVSAFIVLSFLTQCDAQQEEVVTIKTAYGDMVAILYDQTPKHKENFLKLIDRKYYDSLLFHRVIEGFMIQGGDPESKKAPAEQPLGKGGPGYTIPAEIDSSLYHVKGALSAARLSDQQNPKKESSGSQFYIVQGTKIPEAIQKIDQQKLSAGLQSMYQSGQYQPLFDSLDAMQQSGDMTLFENTLLKLAPRVEKITGMKVTMNVSPAKLKAYSEIGGAPFLDGGYTVFGQVISGLDVIDKIAAIETTGKGYSDRPVEDVRMTITHKKMSRSKIEKEYGYKFPAAPAKKK